MANLRKIVRDYLATGIVATGIAVGFVGLCIPAYLAVIRGISQEISKPTQETYSDIGKDIYVPFKGWCKMENTDANPDIDVVFHVRGGATFSVARRTPMLVAPDVYDKYGKQRGLWGAYPCKMTRKMQKLLTDISEEQKAFAFEYHNALYQEQESKKAKNSNP